MLLRSFCFRQSDHQPQSSDATFEVDTHAHCPTIPVSEIPAVAISNSGCSKGDASENLLRPTQERGGHPVVYKVFELTDLTIAVCHYLPLVDIQQAAAVCSCFPRACSSDCVWQSLCENHWRAKWGFEARWARATTGLAVATPWRKKYLLEEADSLRSSISSEELHSLSFDFRFRFNLTSSSTTDMCFGPPQWDVRDSHVPRNIMPGITCGSVSGHPNDDVRLTWVLGRDGRRLQWGLWPQYWPMGEVRRLPTWGWEVINSNVVLRAVDEHMNDHTRSESLWSDLLGDLVLA